MEMRSQVFIPIVQRVFLKSSRKKIYKEQLGIISNIDGLRGIAPWILLIFGRPKELTQLTSNTGTGKALSAKTGQKKKAYYVLKGFYEIIEKKYKSN